MCHSQRLNTSSINHYKNHRFPIEIISHAVWLHCHFCHSYRDVEELLFTQGVTVTKVTAEYTPNVNANNIGIIYRHCRTDGGPDLSGLQGVCVHGVEQPNPVR